MSCNRRRAVADAWVTTGSVIPLVPTRAVMRTASGHAPHQEPERKTRG